MYSGWSAPLFFANPENRFFSRPGPNSSLSCCFIRSGILCFKLISSLSKNINPSLVLVQPRNTRPFITDRLMMGRKESNQTNKNGFMTKCSRAVHPLVIFLSVSLPSVMYVYCSPVVTCWERPGLLALLCMSLLVTFQ